MSYHNNILHAIHDITGSGFWRHVHPARRGFMNCCDIQCCDTDIFGNRLINNDNEYTISLDVPGISKEDLRITINESVLRVKTEYENKESNEQREYEFALRIPNDVDTENTKVVLSQGVLNITLPKSEKAKPKLLEVKEVV